MFTIFIRILNALLMIALPLGLGIFLARKPGAAWRIFGAGMLTFALSQVFHIPFNIWMLDPVIERLGLTPSVPLGLGVIAVLAGLSAGVFEECARYLGFRFWLGKPLDRTWGGALMFGAGHGGIEAILLGVSALAGVFVLFALRDGGLPSQISPEQIGITQAQITAYWSLPWYAALLGAAERAVALSVHLSASVIVLQAFRRQNLLWLLWAILWHAAVDATAVFAAKTWGIYVTEGVLAGFGLLGVAIIFLLREPAVNPEIAAPLSIGQPPLEVDRLPPSPENLEDSRYV